MAKLEQVLVEEKVLTAEQVQQCRDLKAQHSLPLGMVAVWQGMISERQLLDLVGRPLAEPIEDFVPEGIPASLTQLIAAETAQKLSCVPVYDSGQELRVAFANEVDELQIEKLAELTGRKILPFLTTPETLAAAYALLYGAQGGAVPGGQESSTPEGDGEMAAEGIDLAGGEKPEGEGGEAAAAQDDGEVPDIEDFKELMTGALDEVRVVQEQKESSSNAYGIEIEANSPPIIKLVNGMLIKALNLRASDIHIEPQETGLRVRVRVDGEMHILMKLPKEVSCKIVSRVKLMAELNITEKRNPQDGRFKVQLGGGGMVEFRVNCLPSAFGEKIVMRVLGGNKLKGDVAGLGFSSRDLDCVLAMLKCPWGLALVTGPTGSGKTTTLYTMLKSLNTPNRNILTAEDPIEYNLAGITQTPINAAVGFTFEKALRAFLRQDPDVILVGEVRDKETAEICAKAAMTGHLVLSTLHTNDAASTVMRLKDIGVDPFLLGASLKLVIAQRLVRLLCPACKVPTKLADADKVGLKPEELALLTQVFRGRGCPECNNIGYKGRRPVFEVMPITTAKMKAAVMEGGTAIIETMAKEEGMQSIRHCAMTLAGQGVTSFQEALKVGVVA
ncbi:MAG: Flp pilus assembly complex ATPase component TadA [Elusimicrobia bacterium]|nr:Flp pilus assembly complex ATPase component TadA [Elusimicrobiota bacterium]